MNTQAVEVQVWDPWVRLFHWGLVILVLVTLTTGDHLLKLHVLAGHGILGLVLFRLVWGFVGTKHALFRDFLFSPSHIFKHLKTMTGGIQERYLGHNPAGGIMIIILITLLTLLCISGLLMLDTERGVGILEGVTATIPIFMARWMEDIHEALGALLWLLIVLHLGGVILESWLHGENLVWSMITGKKRS
ncbi:MAG: cytochrome b/b6 domain-containing protein [Magnetococcales bacterium]|nr:cytochrome b/b6 domain-containing protein [Magnetococcales bacterium]